MGRISTLLIVIGGWLATGAHADTELAKGQLLVASHEVPGPFFAESVVLLIQYSDKGAMGLVVNRPTQIAPTEALSRLEGLSDYRGTLYLGGPVEVSSVRALALMDESSELDTPVFGRIHLAPFNETLLEPPFNDASRLRFYVGYAGWAPGQLENEMARGDWQLHTATEELVFAEFPLETWEQLAPPAKPLRDPVITTSVISH